MDLNIMQKNFQPAAFYAAGLIKSSFSNLIFVLNQTQYSTQLFITYYDKAANDPRILKSKINFSTKTMLFISDNYVNKEQNQWS